jgi:5-formyltetrahydrofolate cyclo-ligase
MIIIDEDYEHYEKEIDLFIIPGRAFTLDWKRLGRGKWYYDRFLAQKIYKKSKKIWICFDFQVHENIPTEKHDIMMNKIITNA